MADEQEKTEEPTSRKIEDAKKEGNVPKSIDTAGFAGLFVATVAFIAMLGLIFERIGNLFNYYFSFFGTSLEKNLLYSIAITTTKELLILVLPIAILVALAGSIAHIAQFGFIFTVKPLQPDIKKIDPIKGAKNLFSLQKLIDGTKITAKVAVAFFVGGYVFLIFISELPTVELFPFWDQIRWLIDKAIFLAFVMLAIFLIFAGIDLVIVRYQYFKKLRMSKQELKDEYKNTEGNPEIKGKIRRLQQEMSRNRMMSDVPSADVVITNPTHFAVALRFDKDKEHAPRVIAKGADLIALKIREIAVKHGIQIYESPELARELYKSVDIGKTIPESLFAAVAEILAYVYKSENRSF